MKWITHLITTVRKTDYQLTAGNNLDVALKNKVNLIISIKMQKVVIVEQWTLDNITELFQLIPQNICHVIR
jgi:hypothetical protein